jgi:cytochrome c553
MHWALQVRNMGRTRLVPLAAMLLLVSCNRVPTPGLARGETLYTTCAKCHGDQGEGQQLLHAPAIGGLPTWYVETQLANFAAAHRGYEPFDTAGIMMKSVAWTLDREGDVPSVAQYIATLQPPRAAPVMHGDAALGQTTFQTCAACHGPAAEGNADVHAPPLAGRSDWYLIAQLRKFKAGQRGTNPADIWGQTMRPQAMILDDSTMTNVVAYIQTLGGGTAAR